MPVTKILTILDKDGNTILPRTRSAAITLSDGITTLDQAIDNAIVLKGSVEGFSNLPTESLRVGDLYYVNDEEIYYFWNDISWAPLGLEEIDPIFTAWDKSTGILITESQISDLQTYLTSETDPIFIAWDKSTGISITESQISDFGEYQIADPNIVSDASYVHTDNNFTTILKTKLDGIEEGATADQTAAEIKLAYESNDDTNAFTDAEKSKLVNIESGAEVNIDYTASNGVVRSDNDFSLDSTYRPTFNGASFDDPIQIHGVNVTEFTPFPYSMISGRCDRDGYTQFYVQNFNDGPNASADMVLYNDLSDNESFLLDMGLNSSSYSSEDYPLFTSNSAYIYTGSDGTLENPSDLFIGTSSPNSDIVFFSGGFDLNHEVMRIGSDGSITIADSESSGQEFTVNGAATFNGATEFTNTVILPGSPSTDLEAATKYYVDSVAQGLSIKDSVVAGTISSLASLTGGTIVYDNGTGGDGATLTISVAGTYDFLDSEVWDGYDSISTGVRVLIKDQVSLIQNGIYEITSSTVLTRTPDFNSDATIEPGSFVFVANGDTIAGTSWVLSTEVNNVGTDPINIQQFGGGASYSAGTNIDITNNVVSVSGTIAATKGGTGTSTVATGDLLYGSSTNNWSKLTLGTAYKSLVVNASGTQLEWNSIALNTAAVSGTLPITNGGTGATTAAGALINLGLTATAAELNALDGITATVTELNYTDGVTSNIQTQLNDKAASSHTHGNITNAGAIGSTADLIVKTTTSGVLTTLAAGTTSQYLRGDGTWQTVSLPSGLTSGSTSSGYLQYAGTTATAGQLDGGTTAPTATTRLNYGGYLYATRVYNAVFNDYAEYFEKGEEIEPGDVVVKALNSNKYIKSTIAYDKKVIGVCSDSYGHLLGGTGNDNDDENFTPIGLSGRVSVKVVGQIAEGDLLTTSNIPGVAMLSEEYKPGTIIGKALESYNSKEIGKIKILIMNI